MSDTEKQKIEHLEETIEDAKQEAEKVLGHRDEGFWDDKAPRQGPAGDADVAPPG
jgi:hypothetical protein